MEITAADLARGFCGGRQHALGEAYRCSVLVSAGPFDALRSVGILNGAAEITFEVFVNAWRGRFPSMWSDGINAGEGFIRQFVAVPLGLGATVEAQVTGQEIHGGVQLRVVGATAEVLKAWQERSRYDMLVCGAPPSGSTDEASMGLGAGGRMRQEIYADERGPTDYNNNRTWRVFVHLCSAAQWTAITGEVAPPTPINREIYVQHGFPWFDCYDADREDLAASHTLSRVKTVGNLLDKDDEPFSPIDPSTVIKLKDGGAASVAPGVW